MVTFGIVSGWALTHVANHNPAFFFFFLSFHALKNLPSSFSLKDLSSFSTYFFLLQEIFLSR